MNNKITVISDEEINELSLTVKDNPYTFGTDDIETIEKLIAHYQATKDAPELIVKSIEKAFGKEIVASDGMVMISMHKFNTMVGEINKILSPTTTQR